MLTNAPLVEQQTMELQDAVWRRFREWLLKHLKPTSCDQLFICPQLAAKVLEHYGVQLYSSGAALYELRHLLVLVQQQRPEIKIHLGAAWQLVTKWEQVAPVKHRAPLPEVLYRAMMSIAILWQWYRWAAALTVGFNGMTRIGEALNATRGDLVLPSDGFEPSMMVAFLQIRKPKTRRRGKGRIQHAKLEAADEVLFLERHVATLHHTVKLFPLSASAFRSRWDKILETLNVPLGKRPTPASVRGGGAIAAYRRGKPIADIMWGMRIGAASTLESYLQELSADNFLIRLPETSKQKLRQAAALYPTLIAR